LENLKGRDHLEDQGFDGGIILERILEKLCGAGFIWFRIGSSGGLLCRTAMKLSAVQKAVTASQTGLCSLELVITET
jgi:hypothetical protein